MLTKQTIVGNSSRDKVLKTKKTKKAEKLDEIESVVARLFAYKGYHSTSMREIARELGMNQSSVYHYFRSKEEILFKLMNDAMNKGLAALEDICASGLSPEDKLKEALSFYTRYYAEEQEREILLVNEMNSLSDDYRAILIRGQRHYINLFKSILSELADDQKLKNLHLSVVLFAFFGMVHYTPKWYRKDGPVGLEELASTFVEIFTKGIFE